MLDLGNGTIYVDHGEPLPFSCPECLHPIPYTQKQTIKCKACDFQADRSEFRNTYWQLVPAN